MNASVARAEFMIVAYPSCMLDTNGLLGVIEEVVALRDRMLSVEIARAYDIESGTCFPP